MENPDGCSPEPCPEDDQQRESSALKGLIEEDASQAPGLCTQCKAMIEAWESKGLGLGRAGGLMFYETAVHLETTVLEGCGICELLWEQLLDEHKRLLRQSLNDSNEGKTFVKRRFHRWVAGSIRTMRHYHVSATGKEFAASIINISDELGSTFTTSRINLGTSTESVQALDWASKWLERCARLHVDCQNRSKFIPTRLIDCGTDANPFVRLVLGHTLELETEYLTLSHCWGGNLPIRLLRSNFSSMLERVPFEDLPKTFQDSIFLLRRLGKRYIWIDCLCIIQDDNDMEDWRREAAKMSFVYGSSVYNISATASSNSSEGLFRQRHLILPQKLRIKINMGGKPGWFYFLAERDCWSSEIDNSPLNQRAWVCQERFLSSCNLHFGKRQIFWECREFAANETFTEGLYHDGNRSTFVQSDRKRVTYSALGDPSAVPKCTDQEGSRYAAWYKIVADYTTRKLSFQQDKLIAISGLAAAFAKSNGDEYLAGLWKSRLFVELLWRAARSDKTSSCLIYTAPTWSWAAIDGEVWTPCPSAQLKPAANFVSTAIECASEDIFGSIKSATFTLQAPLAAGYYISSWNGPGFSGFKDTVGIRFSAEEFEPLGGQVSWDLPLNVRFKELVQNVDSKEEPVEFIMPLSCTNLNENMAV